MSAVPHSENREVIPAWVPSFRQLLRRTQSGAGMGALEEVAILSDYSATREYNTISFLIIDYHASPEWPALRQTLRGQMGDRRRFRYASLNPANFLNRQLARFLEIADALHGACVTVAVHREIDALVSTPASLEAWRQRGWIRSSWRPRQFEHGLRISQFLALILAEVSGGAKKIEWVSDQDDAFANDARAKDMTEMLRASLVSYMVPLPTHVLVGTSEIDEGHLGVEDLLAIPDLAAGALGELLSWRGAEGERSFRSRTVGGWLKGTQGALVKSCIEVRLEDSQTIVPKLVDFAEVQL